MAYFYQVVMYGTICILSAYVYLFILYRERFMGIWVISWSLFFGRLVLFDFGPLDWRQSVMGFMAYQILIVGTAIIFLWGTRLFVDKPFKSYWLYGAVIVVFFGTILALLQLPLNYKILLPIEFGSVILIYTGGVFIYHVRIKGIGNVITGYTFILWGLLSVTMPYTIGIPWLDPWCRLLGGIFRFFITVGLLLVYLEKTRADLLHKETQYRLLAENAVDIIYRYRLLPETKFEYISPSVFTVTGYTPEEFYANARLLVKLIHPDDLLLVRDLVIDTFIPGDLPFSVRLVRKDQNTIWVEQKGTYIYDQRGMLTALEGIIRDVTARKNMEQIVSRVEKMNLVGQMAASVAHEIRNPLTSVRGYLQLMRMKEEHKSSLERLDLMINELDRTNEIITEYLMLAKNKIPDLKRCCMNAIIKALIPLMEAAIGYSKVEIKFFPGNIPEVYLDENEIRQLLVNLVNNGVDAMPAGGELVIRTFLDEDCVVVAVSDQGSGIPKQILDTIGTPFMTTKNTGTGLGLPICYRIVNRHNATIHVKTGDHGTTFFVRFNRRSSAAS